MNIESFFDERTSTLTYVVFDPESGDAVVVDPVLDYSPIGSQVWTESVDQVISFVRDKNLTLRMILETHAHADHLSGSQRLKASFPEAKLAIGERITEVQKLFKKNLDLPESLPTDGRQFDRLLKDGERVDAGSLSFDVMFTPGHTPACATYKFDDSIFTGDLLFMPDQGTGRCDFPAGSADDMYASITEKIYTLPSETRVFVGHDYQPGGRPVAYESTVGEEKEKNVQLPAGVSREEFVQRREARDAKLSAPKIIYQSIQVNVDAGRLPPPHANGMRYFNLPINVFGSEDPQGAKA